MIEIINSYYFVKISNTSWWFQLKHPHATHFKHIYFVNVKWKKQTKQL